MKVADTQFGSALQVGDKLTCLENTYWAHKSGRTPPDVTVTKIMVGQVQGRDDKGGAFVMRFATAQRDLLADSPDQITYAFGEGERTTWKKVA